MADKGMNTYPVGLAAGVPQTLKVSGDFFHVFLATDPLTARFDDRKAFNIRQGVGMRVFYDEVTLKSATSQTVEIALGYGYVNDSRASVAATITAPIEPAAVNVALPDVSVGFGAQVSLTPADLDQLEILVGVASTEANGVRVGGPEADATHGVLVEPGQSIAIGTREQLFAYNPAGAGAVNVTLTQLKSA